MAEYEPTPHPSSEPTPVAAAEESASTAPDDDALTAASPTDAAVVLTPPENPPAPERWRRFEGPPEPDVAMIWRRHWIAVLGLILFTICLHGLLGEQWSAWRFSWPSKNGDAIRGPVAVVIDPGHGGGDTGAVALSMVEKDLNLDVGRRVAQALTARGIKVRLTREDDHFISLEERVRTANSLPGAIFVSIHFNDASGDGRVAMNRASGIETFYSENKAMSASAGGWMWASLYGAGAKADPVAARDVQTWSAHEGSVLAQSIQGALVTGTAATDRGIKERSLYVTRRVRAPAVLVEGGFVSHPGEARLLGDPAYRQKLADGIADGIGRYLDAAAHQSVPPAVAAASLGV